MMEIVTRMKTQMKMKTSMKIQMKFLTVNPLAKYILMTRKLKIISAG